MSVKRKMRPAALYGATLLALLAPAAIAQTPQTTEPNQKQPSSSTAPASKKQPSKSAPPSSAPPKSDAAPLATIPVQEVAAPAPNPSKEKNVAVELSGVVITAQKRKQANLEVPISVTAMTGKRLEDMGARNLQDIAAETPGLTVVESGPGIQQVQIRGISSTVGSSTVGYQFDNVSLTSFINTQPDATTYDLASVEILRGPQGTLYGEGSMGGTIKLISNAPKMGKWLATTQTSYALTEIGDPSTEFNAALNVPVTENSAARLVVGYKDLGGYIDEVAQAKPNANFVRKDSARLRYLWNVSDNFNINLLAMANGINAGAANVGDENYQRFDLAEVGVDDINHIYSVDLEWSTPWVKSIVLTTGYSTRGIAATFDGREGVTDSLTVRGLRVATGIPQIPDSPLLDSLLGTLADGAVGPVPSGLNNQTRTVVSELRLSSDAFNERFHWTAGVFGRRNRYIASLYSAIQPNTSMLPVGSPDAVAVTLVDTDQRFDAKSVSVFGQLEYDLFSWANLAVGGRYFLEKQNVDVTGTINSQDAASSDELHSNKFTPRYTLSFSAPRNLFGFIDQTLVYFSVADGFRSGGANLRTTGSGASPTYRPDVLRSAEVGTKMIFWDNFLTMELAGFATRWKDVQVIVQEPGATITSIANAGNARGFGVDWTFTFAPLKGLTIVPAGEFINTYYVTDTTSKSRGDPVDFVPPLVASLAIAYKNKGLRFIPNMYRLDFSRQLASRLQSRSSGVDRKSDGIRSLNARLGYERKGFNVYAFGRNLLDDRKRVDPNLPDRAARQRPINYGVELIVPF